MLTHIFPLKGVSLGLPIKLTVTKYQARKLEYKSIPIAEHTQTYKKHKYSRILPGSRSWLKAYNIAIGIAHMNSDAMKNF